MKPSAQDALSLAAAIVRGETSAQAALQSTLEAVARLNPQVNAIDTQAPQAAMHRAQALDAELAGLRTDTARAAFLEARPFFGVPLPLKDLGTACVDLPSSMGSAFFRFTRFERDAELVRRYHAAGFVPFARSTSPELGVSPSTEATVYGGPTRNPYHLDHSAGGSSGGAAASVASGMVRIAHASDGLGSIRIPAANCGLVGLKPSRGLMPAGPMAGEAWGGLATEHVVSLSVRDSAAALDATAGTDEGAPYAAPSFLRGDAMRAVQAALRGRAPRCRIGLLDRSFGGEPVHPEVSQAVRAAAQGLQALGHTVDDSGSAFGVLDFDVLELLRPAMDIVASGTAMSVRLRAQLLGREPGPDDLSPTVHGAVRYAEGISGPRYLQQLGALHGFTRRISAFWRDYDVLLLPVLAEPPALLGRFAMTNPDFVDYRIGPRGIAGYSPFTPLANVTGQPALSLPGAWSSQGLPIGVQLIGRFGADALLLGLAAQLEAARAA